MRRYFGTDGIRGRAGEGVLTAEQAMRVGRLLARMLLKRDPSAKVVVGRDTRWSGEMLESALTGGLMASGVSVLLAGVLPTPAVSALVRRLEATAGIMLSASHNPFPDNGIKLFGPDGFKLSDAEEGVLEAALCRRSRFSPLTDRRIGRAQELKDAELLYQEHLRRSVASHLSLRGVKLVLDAGHGAGHRVGKGLFRELGAEVVLMGAAPTGDNINEACGALHVSALRDQVVQTGAHLGVALDGDADRAILVDEKGQVADGDVCLALFSDALERQGKLPQGIVVATLMSNLGLEWYLKARGRTLLRTDVGDRYVVEAMRQGAHPLGGEQSGHIIFLEHAQTGDGLLTALKACEVLQTTSQPLSSWTEALERAPQILLNVRLKTRRPLNTVPGLEDAILRVTEILGDSGRVNVRLSGTEPLARVMLEGRDEREIRRLGEGLVAMIAEHLA